MSVFMYSVCKVSSSKTDRYLLYDCIRNGTSVICVSFDSTTCYSHRLDEVIKDVVLMPVI